MKFKHELIGLNSRLDTIQAIILNEKLKKLTFNNSKRKNSKKFYNQNIPTQKLKKIRYSKSCFFINMLF